ncbi:hypothetical protein [Lysinibacillus halotolerans]|uniref:Resolvase HTH domain-containing protein n=1 Tax=Lysinibacillus halotolerans TaxID=1368476 RepID=A0A3M8HA87_9BACI|nr:hypothetical protein [Lysinibacillus halotolerans]RNC99229.1 hypothetical protein EC501_08650 [Lysinibacillus halotolerans]
MDLSMILMIIGIVCIVVSFFLKDTSKRIEKDLEDLSISIYQETNSLKKRLKIVEEELLLEPNFSIKSASTPKIKETSVQKKQPTTVQQKQVNEILVSQVIQLNKQGYPIEEISKMSTLSTQQILSILRDGR